MEKAKLVVNIHLADGRHWSPELTRKIEGLINQEMPSLSEGGFLFEVDEYLAEAGGEDRPDNTMGANNARMYGRSK
jgi:hypothetical protein